MSFRSVQIKILLKCFTPIRTGGAGVCFQPEFCFLPVSLLLRQFPLNLASFPKI